MSEPTAEPKSIIAVLDAWDPLAPTDDDVDMFAAAQKREIRNILKSYTGYYDLFSEMVQNALDAVEKRSANGAQDYQVADLPPVLRVNCRFSVDTGRGQDSLRRRTEPDY